MSGTPSLEPFLFLNKLETFFCPNCPFSDNVCAHDMIKEYHYRLMGKTSRLFCFSQIETITKN